MMALFKIIRLGTFASILGLQIASPLAADPTGECGVNGATQVEISACIVKQLKVTNLALKETLSTALDTPTQLDAETTRNTAVPAFHAAQAAWEKYRDAQCNYVEALYASGSGGSIAKADCLITKARLRDAELAAGSN